MRSCAGSGQVACHEAGALLPEGTVTFGEVIGWLADEIETEGRATLARRLVKNRRFAQRRHCWPRACNRVVASAVAAQSSVQCSGPGFPHMVQRADNDLERSSPGRTRCSRTEGSRVCDSVYTG